MAIADADMTASAVRDSSPRRETFLARYPRNLKLGVVTAFLACTLLPSALPKLIGHTASQSTADKTKTHHETQVEGAERSEFRSSSSTDMGSFNPAVTNPAALNNQDDKTIKLAPAPDPALTEDTTMGSLPRMSEDGRAPWQVYARPYNLADQRPRIAIVVAGLGLSRVTSDAAINQLSPSVTLAFDVQSPVTAAWCSRARQAGHEVLISLPMEPFDYPRSDPGPHTLLTSLPNSDNIQRLLWALRQGTGYVGITSLTGSRFTTDPEKMRPVMDIISQRGLMILDARVAPHSVIADLAKDGHLPTAVETVTLDDTTTPAMIGDALGRLEKEARLNGRAIAVVIPTPLILDQLQSWIKDLPARGISLAPVSAIAH